MTKASVGGGTMTAVISVAMAIIIVLTPVPAQCQDPTFSRANPGLCDLHSGGPFPDFPGGGGGNSGGFIGGIIHAIGKLL